MSDKETIDLMQSQYGDVCNLRDELWIEVKRLKAINAELIAALEILARLGNGDYYANSDGNRIAQAAIANAQRGNR